MKQMINAKQGQHIALITGASAGIGLELTRKLISDHWQVIAINRSDLPAEEIELHKAIANGSLRIYRTADLSDYGSLKTTLNKIKANEDRIDVLFNNAGGSFPELAYSPQGREEHYELMTVVPYIIMMELKALLANGDLKTVINTSSSALKFVKAINVDILERPQTFRKLLGPYATSKLALSLWTRNIAPHLAKEGISIRSVDPGSNNTLRKGKNSGLPFLVKPMMKLFFSPPSHGANLLHDGAIGQHRDESGVFLLKGRITDLKFEDQAQSVLDRVQEIYETEFLGARTA